jgi:disulfide bond formation protein DsbB
MTNRRKLMTAHLEPRQDVDRERRWLALFAAWSVALGSTLGALFIGEIMGQAPCSLCWHQRAFMFPMAIILGIAALRNDFEIWIYALPLSLAGGMIAGFHSLLYADILPREIEPCGSGPSCSSAAMTILGGVPIPYLSAAAFMAIALLLLGTRSRRSK